MFFVLKQVTGIDMLSPSDDKGNVNDVRNGESDPLLSKELSPGDEGAGG